MRCVGIAKSNECDGGADTEVSNLYNNDGLVTDTSRDMNAAAVATPMLNAEF